MKRKSTLVMMTLLLSFSLSLPVFADFCRDSLNRWVDSSVDLYLEGAIDDYGLIRLLNEAAEDYENCVGSR